MRVPAKAGRREYVKKEFHGPDESVRQSGQTGECEKKNFTVLMRVPAKAGRREFL